MSEFVANRGRETSRIPHPAQRLTSPTSAQFIAVYVAKISCILLAIVRISQLRWEVTHNSGPYFFDGPHIAETYLEI
jgi:hypothetical protein